MDEKINKHALLELCPLFHGLSQWELKSIGQLMRLVEFKKDEIVYEEGREANSFYVVVSGRFEASIQAHDKKKVLAYLRRGDYFGEMSLLTNEPHSATLKTLSDALVLELKKEDFKKTIEHNAMISLEISRRLSSRLKGDSSSHRTLSRSDVISLFYNQRPEGADAFSLNLATSLFQETHQKTVLVDLVPEGQNVTKTIGGLPKISLKKLSHIAESTPLVQLSGFIARHSQGFDVMNLSEESDDSFQSAKVLTALLNLLVLEYRFVLLDLPNPLSETVLKALSQSDSIYFVTDSHINNISEAKEIMVEIEKTLNLPEAFIAVVIYEAVFGVHATSSIKKELFPNRACFSLSAPGPQSENKIRHIARRVSNNLVGLALGSGAAFGLAHIGVLKILEREKIPIDIIVGSSIGALIGSLYAAGCGAEAIEKLGLQITSALKLANLMDVSLFPVRGLLNGESVTRHYKKLLGNKTFEEALITLKVVGTNLSAGAVHVYDSGLIADAVRASISIPAIFKPVKHKSDWVVDGGIMSPLPVHTLHEAGANKVIAVNVFPTSRDILERRLVMEETAEKEKARMRQKNLWTRTLFGLGKLATRTFSPNFVDILMNTIQTMEHQISEVEGQGADLVIRPVIPEANWWEIHKPSQFIKRGEEETLKLLPQIKSLVWPQNP